MVQSWLALFSIFGLWCGGVNCLKISWPPSFFQKFYIKIWECQLFQATIGTSAGSLRMGWSSPRPPTQQSRCTTLLSTWWDDLASLLSFRELDFCYCRLCTTTTAPSWAASPVPAGKCSPPTRTLPWGRWWPGGSGSSVSGRRYNKHLFQPTIFDTVSP